jgi:hypothetical protein
LYEYSRPAPHENSLISSEKPPEASPKELKRPPRGDFSKFAS